MYEIFVNQNTLKKAIDISPHVIIFITFLKIFSSCPRLQQ